MVNLTITGNSNCLLAQKLYTSSLSRSVINGLWHDLEQVIFLSDEINRNRYNGWFSVSVAITIPNFISDGMFAAVSRNIFPCTNVSLKDKKKWEVCLKKQLHFVNFSDEIQNTQGRHSIQISQFPGGFPG